MTQPRYSPEHRQQAERESLPLVTFDIDKRHLKSLPPAQRTRTTMQGCLGFEEADDILNRTEPWTAKRTMPGLNAIVLERFKQARKYPAIHDDVVESDGHLVDAAVYLAGGQPAIEPPSWARDLWNKHAGPNGHVKRLAIAAALFAAEIDRLERKRITEAGA